MKKFVRVLRASFNNLNHLIKSFRVVDFQHTENLSRDLLATLWIFFDPIDQLHVNEFIVVRLVGALCVGAVVYEIFD